MRMMIAIMLVRVGRLEGTPVGCNGGAAFISGAQAQERAANSGATKQGAGARESPIDGQERGRHRVGQTIVSVLVTRFGKLPNAHCAGYCDCYNKQQQ